MTARESTGEAFERQHDMVDLIALEARPVVPGVAEPSQRPPGDKSGAPKVLYIEGHANMRDIIAQLLDLSSEYQIDVAGDGQEGVEKVRSWQPDLILMGLRLPVLDGYEAIKIIRSDPATSDIPIIVLSAWSSATHKERALALGANEHLTPPVETERLIRRINHYIKAQQR
jgi:CheY-like chemotaxis protein